MKQIIRKKRLFICLMLGLAIQACDYLPGTSPTVTFANEILRFDHPESWEVNAGGSPGGLQFVIVTGPSSTEIIFQIYPKQGAPSLQEYAEWFSQEFEQLVSLGEIGNISFTQTTKKIGTEKLTGIREDFMLTVFGFDFPHSREYFAHGDDELLIFVVFQSSDAGATLWGDSIRQIRESLLFN